MEYRRNTRNKTDEYKNERRNIRTMQKRKKEFFKKKELTSLTRKKMK